MNKRKRATDREGSVTSALSDFEFASYFSTERIYILHVFV